MNDDDFTLPQLAASTRPADALGQIARGQLLGGTGAGT
jgi:hypothetical protein